EALPTTHPYRRLVEQALQSRKSQGPVSEEVPVPGAMLDIVNGPAAVEQLVMAHAIEHADRRFLGVMLVARNIAYLSQVQSTIRHSRKLASLGRLLAGVAHEVKNPLNAMTIHLELLKQKLSGSIGAIGTRALGRGAEAAAAGGGRAAGAGGPLGLGGA